MQSQGFLHKKQFSKIFNFKKTFFIFWVFISGLTLNVYANEFEDYNLGTQFLQEGKFEQAFIHLQLAYLNAPFDPTVSFQLNQAERKIQNLSSLIEVDGILGKLIFKPGFSNIILGLSAVTCLYAFFWFYLLFQKSKFLTLHSVGFLVTALLFFLSFLSFDLYTRRGFSFITDKTPALSEPNEKASQLLVFDPAKKVRVVDHSEKWSQVIYSNAGHRAWVLTSDLLPLNIK